MEITLFAVDDSEEYLDSLEKIFEPHSARYNLVKTFSSVEDDDGVEEMLDEIKRLSPHIVLMDISFTEKGRPDNYGIRLTEEILKVKPDQKIIMLAGDNPNENTHQLNKIKQSFRAGAVGYFRKENPEKWFEGIRDTMQGHLFVAQEVSQLIIEYFRKGNTFNLREREIEVLHLLSEDNTSKNVSKLMNIGYNGVNFHIGNAKAKLGVKTLQGLVAKAIRAGILIS